MHVRQLREPRQLAERAAELGFELPERVIDIARVPAERAARLASASAPEPAELQP